MKSNIIHSIVVCLTALALPLMVACGSQEESLPEATEAALYLNIEPIGQTRAGETELSDNEKMKSVRVIVLHQDGKVEHNLHVPLPSAEARKYILLKVKPNERKKIFLFANEESVETVEGVTAGGVTAESRTLTAFFEKYPENTSGFEVAVNDLYFAPNYSKYIPMSSVYEIDFPATGNFDGTFYVVRVATKFDVSITNNRPAAVTLNSFSISSIADKSYLYPHFTKEAGIITGSGKHGFIFNEDCSFNETDNALSWVEWLAKTCEESQTKPEPPQADRRGWIMEYALPPGTNQEKVEWNLTGLESLTMAAYDGKLKLPTQYCPESRNVATGESFIPFNPAAQNIEQQYLIEIKLSDGTEHTFTEVLPNLRALFRNTHVVINITLNKKDIVVDVIPYGEVKLDPIFGLDEKPKE